MSEVRLRSMKEWKQQIQESDDPAGQGVGGDSYQQYKSGVDNDITLEAEDENGIYDAYIERMSERLAKHRSAYKSHVKGSMKSDAFIKDIEITKRLMEDFMAYQDRFIKLATTSQKKAANR